MKNFKSIVITTVILTLICAISAAGLAFTNDLTVDRIASLEEKAQNDAMAEIIPEAEYELKTAVLNENTVNYYIVTKGKDIAGYIFTTVTKGYKGDVNVMTGIDTQGKVIAVKVLSAADETPGLGQNITKDEFIGQFTGLSEHAVIASGKIDSVTGATISSRAVVECVNEAIDLYGKIVKEGAK